MGEPWAKPNNQQVEKLREFLGDPLGWFLMGCSIKAMERLDPNYDIQETEFGEWIFYTRRLIWKFGLVQILGHVYRLAEESADEYWANWTPPKETDEDNKEVSIDPNAKMLSKKIKITDIAKKYGLKVRREKAICPFHDDKNPSLSLSNEKGVFYCFGCRSKGDIITFVRMLEELK